jgi:hypothetical protein
MNKSEKIDMSAKNLSVMAAEKTNVEPKTKFMAKMRIARKTPPLMEEAHLLHVLAA